MMMSYLPLLMIVSYVYAVQWPKGTYTLIKPKVGCPSGWWKEGWRKQDTEDNNNANFLTPGNHFSGDFSSYFVVFNYCTKDEHVLTGYHQWPQGNYCILRSGVSCPRGFETGSIHWDDEDKKNKNSYGGTMPSGSYGKDTSINYCCRDDGYASTPIELPTYTPFYLMRYTAPCQQVQGMLVREEIVKLDDEDSNNNNSVSGSHPLDDGSRDHRLFYCYYY